MLPAAHQSRQVESVVCTVLTVSDTRTPDTDVSGRLSRELLEARGHRVVESAMVRDEAQLVARQVAAWCERPDIQAVLINGGTGLAPRDTTYEAIAGLLERRIDGFGELFRSASFPQIGAAAMLSRAVAGVRSSTAVFSMPGSPAAVRLAMEQLILPALPHLVWLLQH